MQYKAIKLTGQAASLVEKVKRDYERQLGIKLSYSKTIEKALKELQELRGVVEKEKNFKGVRI